jgi:secreted trypsin-like serine protease
LHPTVGKLVASKLACGIVACLLCSCSEPPAPASVAWGRISGGHSAPLGSWPNVVWLDNGCTGALVDRDIVAYAAHCGTDVTAVWSGDSVDVVIDEAAKTIVTTGSNGARYPVKSCATNPDWDLASGNDMAFCVLATAADKDYVQVPSICDVDSVPPGTLTTLVGFGYDGDELPGIKRVADTTVVSVGAELRIGDEVQGTCTGDSGSPAFMRMNGEWQLLGILSSGVQGQPCGAGYYTRADRLQHWLEAMVGTSTTRCDAGAPSQQDCNGAVLDKEGKRSNTSTSPDPACDDPTQSEHPSGSCSASTRTPKGSASFLAGWLLALCGLWRRAQFVLTRAQ